MEDPAKGNNYTISKKSHKLHNPVVFVEKINTLIFSFRYPIPVIRMVCFMCVDFQLNET